MPSAIQKCDKEKRATREDQRAAAKELQTLYLQSLRNGHAFLDRDGNERDIVQLRTKTEEMAKSPLKARFTKICADPECRVEFTTDNPKQRYHDPDCRRRRHYAEQSLRRRQAAEALATKEPPMSKRSPKRAAAKKPSKPVKRKAPVKRSAPKRKK